MTAPLARSADTLSEPIPTLPKDLGPELLKPLLKSGDEESAALAGFALTLLGEMGIPAEERQITIDEIVAGHAAGKLTEAFGAGTAAIVDQLPSGYRSTVARFKAK